MRNAVFQSFGRYLLQARAARGLTQRELARRCGLTQSYLSLLETGARSPTLAQLSQLAEALSLPLQWFINGACRPGENWPDLAIELSALGIVDLLIADPVVPGAFRPPEQVLALALRGDQIEPRVVEALPAVLVWNDWNVRLLECYAKSSDARAFSRVAWLADIAQTIHAHHGFPGGCVSRQKLSKLCSRAKHPTVSDSLGFPADETSLPPVSRRWNITYAADLETFRRRAQHLYKLRTARNHSLTTRRSHRHE